MLSVSPGDVVVVGEAGGSKDFGVTWQRGCNAWGVRGLFPTSCVKELNLSYRSRQLSERSAQAQASDLPPYALGQARALMSLHAQLSEELDFREGDLIIITDRPEPGWFEGELDGHRGIFPEGFVELLGPLRSPQEPVDCQYLNEDSKQFTYEDTYDAEEVEEEGIEEGEVFLTEEEKQKEPFIEEEHKEEGGVYGVALYEFRAMEPGELDFDVGDRICVVNTLEDGWLEGELRGQRGIFPHRFVKMEDEGQKTAEEINVAELDEEKNNFSDHSSTSLSPNISVNDPAWRTYEDHTVWDLDYFERTEEHKWQCENKSAVAQSNNRGKRDGGNRPDTQPLGPIPPSQRAPQRPKSIPPPRPRLPPRPSLPAHRLRQHVAPLSKRNQSNCTNGSIRPLQPKLTHSQTLPNTHCAWPQASKYHQMPSTETTSTNNRSASLSQALINIVEGPKQWRLSRHASVSDADLTRSDQKTQGNNGILPTSITLQALATSASELEVKLSQQLFEFEKSLNTFCSDTNASSEVSSETPFAADQSQQSCISRHFSILDYRDENDIIRGSVHSHGSNYLQSKASSLERRRTLRPPPPRPRVLRPPPPAGCRPARPAPRPPPRCPRQNVPPPPNNSLANAPIFYAPNEPLPEVLTEDQDECGDLAAAQEHEIQCHQDAEQEEDREMELEIERQRAEEEEEEERYQLLVRLQEVEHDMEEYARTAEELRAMLEEEEDEAARMQALENLEFCTYTLETLALEQQQLQGKTPEQ